MFIIEQLLNKAIESRNVKQSGKFIMKHGLLNKF